MLRILKSQVFSVTGVKSANLPCCEVANHRPSSIWGTAAIACSWLAQGMVFRHFLLVLALGGSSQQPPHLGNVMLSHLRKGVLAIEVFREFIFACGQAQSNACQHLIAL